MKALILEHLVLNFKYKNNYIITAVLGEIYKTLAFMHENTAILTIKLSFRLFVTTKKQHH